MKLVQDLKQAYRTGQEYARTGTYEDELPLGKLCGLAFDLGKYVGEVTQPDRFTLDEKWNRHETHGKLEAKLGRPATAEEVTAAMRSGEGVYRHRIHVRPEAVSVTCR